MFWDGAFWGFIWDQRCYECLKGKWSLWFFGRERIYQMINEPTKFKAFKIFSYHLWISWRIMFIWLNTWTLDLKITIFLPEWGSEQDKSQMYWLSEILNILFFFFFFLTHSHKASKCVVHIVKAVVRAWFWPGGWENFCFQYPPCSRAACFFTYLQWVLLAATCHRITCTR